jgi:hypothetical protein
VPDTARHILIRLDAALGPAWIIAVAASVLATLHLMLLSTSPPGYYTDEASFAYNAWCIAHQGVDEHGQAFPLFFQAFGDWKGPVLTYLLVPFSFGNVPGAGLVRLPGALAGIALFLVASRLAWRWSGSRGVTLATMLTAGLMPWLLLESRVAFEDIFMGLLVLVVILALTGDDSIGTRRGAAAGAALALLPFTYPIGRAVAPALLVVAFLTLRSRFRGRALLALALPLLAALAGLTAWSVAHDGALTSRFGVVGLTASHSGPDLVWAFLREYAGYWSPSFLFTQGDAELRHATQYGGVLLITSLPAILVGLATMVRRRGEPRHRFLIGALLVAPMPAALTSGGPVATRSVSMAAVLVAVSAVGWGEIWPWLRQAPRTAGVWTAIGALVAAGFLTDMDTTYPPRAALSFYAGFQDAFAHAHDLAGGRPVYVSATIEQPYIEAAVVVQPSCGGDIEAKMNLHTVSRLDELSPPGSGALLIVRPALDSVPAGAQLVYSVGVTVPNSVYYPDHVFPESDPGTHEQELFDVYRL